MSATMNKAKQALAVFAAAILAFALAVPAQAFAAGTGSITITPPEGVDANATNTYKVYKVFDADGDGENISYKLVNGKTEAPAGFTVDTAGNVAYTGSGADNALTADDIAAIASYVAGDAPVATVTSTGTGAAVASGLPNGYYYITTTTGTVVTIDSANPDATVIDKNTVPTVVKTITGANSIDADGKNALAQVGSTVDFQVVVTAGKGAEGYVFHDTMTAGLSYNGDAAVTGVNGAVVQETPADGDTITIVLPGGIAEGTEITITYSATVTSDALTMDAANNTAYVSYGDNGSVNRTPASEVKVYNAKFTVTKHDGSGAALAGAGFVVANADGKYYKLDGNAVSWVASIDEATEYASDANGAVTAFTGLANGTYTLVEKTVPSGYNKAADSTFTVVAGDYTADNLEQAATVVNNAGIELPSTGGMGTTILYVAGGIMVLVAAVYLITKRRASKDAADDLM